MSLALEAITPHHQLYHIRRISPHQYDRRIGVHLSILRHPDSALFDWVLHYDTRLQLCFTVAWYVLTLSSILGDVLQQLILI